MSTMIENVCAALRGASGPMTSREVREALEDETSANQVATALNTLFARNQVVRMGEPGRYTYLLDPKCKPAPDRAEDTVTQHARAALKTHLGAEGMADVDAFVPGDRRKVTVSRACVVRLLGFAFMNAPADAPPSLNDAIREAGRSLFTHP